MKDKKKDNLKVISVSKNGKKREIVIQKYIHGKWTSTTHHQTKVGDSWYNNTLLNAKKNKDG